MSKKTKEAPAVRVRRYTANAAKSILQYVDNGSVVVGASRGRPTAVTVSDFAEAKRVKLSKLKSHLGIMKANGAPRSELTVWLAVQLEVERITSRRAAEKLARSA